ncbi:glutamine ABC superfamily ATP binding cassette transporter, substrate binding and permease protein [Secundilactobacillus similis DSM 23365 = JCM 2765]|uniref:Glutamine ABC superfamily ATP binding cassette transporter, substrate binding and permease protein n=1 Tax=Secundilactobacillus similis DSM 23365 = JCM 2765 TaxID=1423804 RepID=A0A0R2FF60_9LACO|nr:glutamine ABC superfamily ATP binding cassette transporter, substrate binding and permease protein [Secundilactobacillus similis DSM 23365 = JCM 2765]
MQVILTICLSLLFFIGVSSINHQTAYAADQSLQHIKDKGTLVVAISPDYPPYEFESSHKGKDNIVGMDIQVMKKIAKDLGVKLKLKSMAFNNVLVAVETGKADCAIGGINPTAKRRQSVDFSDIYYVGGQSFLINKTDKGKYTGQKSLENKKIGVQTGTLQYQLAKTKIAGASVKGMDKSTDLVLALKTHKIDALGIETPSAEAYVKNDPDLAMIPSGYKLSLNQTGTAIAFKKGSTSLVTAVNKSVKEIKAKKLTSQYLADAGKYMKVNTTNTSMIHYWKYFAEGIEYTLIISAVSVVIGVALGTLLALMRFAKSKFLHAIAIAYIEFVRGTPLMVQVMFVYFGIGIIVNLPALLSGIIAVSLNSGAYVAEIIRGGINSVSKGQTEAASSLGLKRGDMLRYVVLPQALKNIWPALGNEFVSLIKESSIVSIIGVTDLIYQLNIVRADTYRGVMPVFVAMVIYFVLTFILTRILNFYERKMKHAK